jgi:cytochrome c oxidase assembly protein subunit 15
MFFNKVLSSFSGRSLFMTRKRFRAKITSKNTLYFFTSQHFHSSNFLPKHRPFSKSTILPVLRNGLSRGNSVNLTSQSSILAVTTATKFTKPIVGYWLLGTAGLVFGIVVLGGLTRLTESGLSIVEWKPITGIIPPLNNARWEEEFEKYKQFPEYKL